MDTPTTEPAAPVLDFYVSRYVDFDHLEHDFVFYVQPGHPLGSLFGRRGGGYYLLEGVVDEATARALAAVYAQHPHHLWGTTDVQEALDVALADHEKAAMSAPTPAKCEGGAWIGVWVPCDLEDGHEGPCLDSDGGRCDGASL